MTVRDSNLLSFGKLFRAFNPSVAKSRAFDKMGKVTSTHHLVSFIILNSTLDTYPLVSSLSDAHYQQICNLGEKRHVFWGN